MSERCFLYIDDLFHVKTKVLSSKISFNVKNVSNQKFNPFSPPIRGKLGMISQYVKFEVKSELRPELLRFWKIYCTLARFWYVTTVKDVV